MNLLRQRLYAKRTIIGAVAALCLLFHLLLPMLVNFAIVPKLLYMPTHCPSAVQVKMVPSNLSSTSNTLNPSNKMSHMHHNMPSMTHVNQMHPDTIHKHQHTLSSTEVSSLLFSAAEVKHIIDLAQQLMKHCPLCSHGLEGAVLAPMLLLLVLVILRCFSPVLRLFQGWVLPQHIARASYSWPHKHGPPITL